jgi:hypothetical protein
MFMPATRIDAEHHAISILRQGADASLKRIGFGLPACAAGN